MQRRWFGDWLILCVSPFVSSTWYVLQEKCTLKRRAVEDRDRGLSRKKCFWEKFIAAFTNDMMEREESDSIRYNDGSGCIYFARDREAKQIFHSVLPFFFLAVWGNESNLTIPQENNCT